MAILSDGQVEHRFKGRFPLFAANLDQIFPHQRCMFVKTDLTHEHILHPFREDGWSGVIEVPLHGNTNLRIRKVRNFLRTRTGDRCFPGRHILEHRPAQGEGEVETFAQG
jgi:hypothetical protein